MPDQKIACAVALGMMPHIKRLCEALLQHMDTATQDRFVAAVESEHGVVHELTFGVKRMPRYELRSDTEVFIAFDMTGMVLPDVH